MRGNDQPQSHKTFTGGSAYNFYGGFNTDGNFTRTSYGASLAYRMVPIVKSAVDVIAETANSLPRTIVNADGEVVARSNENTGDSLLLQAIERAGLWYGSPLVEDWVRSLLLSGVGYVELVTNEYRYVRGLHWLNPNAMSIQIGAKGRIDQFFYAGTGQAQMFAPHEIVYTRMFDPLDDNAGWSPTYAALAKANLVAEFDRYLQAYYDNAGQVGVIVSPKDGIINHDQAESMAHQWRSQFRGSFQAFKTFFPSKPTEVTTLDPIDISKPLGVTEAQRRQLLAAYRVPPELVGDTQDSSYQYSPEKKRAFIQTAVIPYLRKVEESINAYAVEYFEPSGYRFAFDTSQYDTVLDADLQALDYTRGQLHAGIINWNEARAMLELEQSPNGDFYMIPQGYTVVSANDLGTPTVVPTPTPEDSMMSYKPSFKAPQFRRYTYNGVTCQATGRRSSSRDDKKYERTVRYDGKERTVHYGDPNLDMQRDNPERRENFLARHSCDEKRDPFAPGFWACLDWQRTDEKATQVDSQDELRAWERKIKNAKQPSVWFETHHIPAVVSYHLRSQLHDDLAPDRVKAIFNEARDLLDMAGDLATEDEIDMAVQRV